MAITPSVAASPTDVQPSLESSPTPSPASIPALGYTRDDVRIPSLTKGWDLSAWRYLPAGANTSSKRHPVVVLAHGLSGNKTMTLDEYAAAFAKAGYAAVPFDYRRWGDSGACVRRS
jgi:dipeptidyl aminopeptidase/acylaminoacyl peptidase